MEQQAEVEKRSKATAGERMTLWDHKGKAYSLPIITAREILSSQVASPRAPEHTRHESDPVSEKGLASGNPGPDAEPLDADRWHCQHCERDFTSEHGLKTHTTRMHKGD